MKFTKREISRFVTNSKLMIEIVRDCFILLVLLAALFLALNNWYFHIGGLPSPEEFTTACGAGPSMALAKPKDVEASVSFIDVGQGDCELIRANGVNILIDSGEEEYKDDVIGFLEYSGVESLDYVIVSHPHSDHCGGMYKILREFKVEVIMPELPSDLTPNSLAYKRMMTVIKSRNISARYIKDDERIELGEGCYFELFAPRFYDYDDVNDFSITAKFVHGENSFLFTGDLQEFSELDLLESGADIDADVLKVGHHGSAGASCKEFLNAVTPKIAVFEVSEFNYYRHPRTEVIERLIDAGCRTTYSTANNSCITMVSSGSDLRVDVDKAQALVLDGI